MSKYHLNPMTRRRAISSLAALGAGSAFGRLACDPVPPTSTPPQRSDFDCNKKPDEEGKWRNIYWGAPWGIAPWSEPSYDRLSPVLDIDLPGDSQQKPANGWPVIVYYHPTGPTKSIKADSVLDVNIRRKATANGYVFISVEFRHPSPLSEVIAQPLPLPHTDVGLSIQFIRSLHQAFELDRDQINVVCFSRGNLAIWQAMQPDMADSMATVYAKRQSSRIQAIWSVSGQATYSSREWAELFIAESEWESYLDCHPNDDRLGSAWTDLMNMSDTSSVPPIAMVHDRPYFPGPVSKYTMEHLCDNKHFPNNGSVMRDAYFAKGLGDRIITWDNEPIPLEQQRECIEWFSAIRQGAIAAEAWAMARAFNRGHQLFYVRTPYDDLRGVASKPDGTGVPDAPAGNALGGMVGGVADGSRDKDGKFGLGSRAAGQWAIDSSAGQPSNNNKPRLKIFPLTGRYGLYFESDDRLSVKVANPPAVQSCYSWTLTTEYSEPAHHSATLYQFGQSSLTDQTMSLTVGSASPDALRPNDLKGYRQFANAIAGSTFTSPGELQPPTGNDCDPDECEVS